MTTSADYVSLSGIGTNGASVATPIGLRAYFVAFQFAINAVVTEDPTTANHANRIAFANKIIANKIDHSILALACLTDTTVQTQVTADESGLSQLLDSTLDGRLQAQWNNLANAGL